MDELFGDIVVLVDGLPSDQTLLGATLLLVASLARRSLIRSFRALVAMVFPFRITFRLRSGSLYLALKADGWGLWVWLNTFWRRR